MSPQESWAEKLFAQAGDTGIINFWVNYLNPNSLRLTKLAFLWLKDRHTFWCINLQDQILPKTFLKLERAMKSPYYIKNAATLFILDEADFIMLQLHSCNLENYLDSLLQNGEENASGE